MEQNLGVFKFIGVTLDNLINQLVLGSVQNLMNGIMPLVVVGVAIYIMVQAYAQITGRSNDLAIDVFYSCLGVVCITTLTLNVGNYTTYIVGGVQALGDGLSSAISTGKQDQSIYASLDNLLQQGLILSGQYFNKVDWPPTTWVWAWSALIVFVSMTALTLISAIIIIGTKFVLAILLIVGPLFLTLACFPVTRKYSENWISKVFENILIQIFGVTIIYLALDVLDSFLGFVDTGVPEDFQNVMAFSVPTQVLVIGFILAYIIKQIPYLASTLASSGISAGLLSLPDKLPLRDTTPPKTEAEKYYIRQNSIARDESRKAAQNTNHHHVSSDLLERIQRHNEQNYDD
ncbi:type IV secretion system protein [Photobacterium damselae]|uniref:type IV secretion system protein n=1 Tax=Photobacterium damselae TaxID=38293 RepID=UPI00165E2ADE|nr:type IV secretion system protein [Photobacterium damselae]